MGDPDVRETGRAGAGGSVFAVGAGRGAVTLALPGIRARLTAEQADELAGHLVTATWRAIAHRAARDEGGDPERRPPPAVEPVSGGVRPAAGSPRLPPPARIVQEASGGRRHV